MEIIYKKVDELIPYEKNPRLNDEAVKYVANSIKEFGFKVPMVIDKNGTIVAGHTRYKASLELGLKEVPCIIADDLSEEQIKAYTLAHNKLTMNSDFDIDILNDELDDILNIDMSNFGFENIDIDWDNIEELTDTTYDKPEHNMLECPACHHIDRDIHFKKIESDK